MQRGDHVYCDCNNSYYSAQNLLSSRLLSKNLKSKIYMPIVLYGCEGWSLTLREERRNEGVRE